MNPINTYVSIVYCVYNVRILVDKYLRVHPYSEYISLELDLPIKVVDKL